MMFNYALGAVHAVTVCGLIFLLYPPARVLPPSLSPETAPVTVHYKPDCYVSFPDEGEIEALPLTFDHLVELTYESPKP